MTFSDTPRVVVHYRDLIHTRPTTNGTNSVRTHLGTLLALAIGPEVVKLVRHRYGSATLLIESEQGLDENLSLFLLYIFFLSLERKNGDSKLSPILA